MSELVDDVLTFFDEYFRLFFTGDALRRMLLYACNKCTMEVTDPICTTLAMFISSPLTFAVTRMGLVPFKDYPMVVFPYTHMTREQKVHILRFLLVMQPMSAGHVSTQLGGGMLISLGRRYTRVTRLSAASVLVSFCRTVLQHSTYTCNKTQLDVCNVVLQRLGVMVGISRGTMKEIHDQIDSEVWGTQKSGDRGSLD